jgi:serine/threonine protein kinase
MLLPLPDDLPIGTLLQNRYRVQQILGQGGFGRAYLAEDQWRFRELCVLKEFTPQQRGVQDLRKAKALFQREAEILYKLEHPQIPKFHATFEQDQRLFLVQDYIRGKTYQELLDQQPSQTPLLSESEALQLLRQMLEVLRYLHRLNIIHRDISPDNIVLRENGNLPVLIDFGAVKEATGLSHPAVAHTRIGKQGYSPPEQTQSGKPVQSSDLYSLAVTIIVLLTGRQPDELFDSVRKVWRWERWARVSPKFASILNRMLRYDRAERYQSVDEIMPLLATAIPLPANLAQPFRPSAITRSQPTVNVVGAPSPASTTHPDYSWWDRVFAAIGAFTWKMSSRFFRFFWKLTWDVARPLLQWFGRFVQGTFKLLIKLLLLVGLGWLVWTSIVQYKSAWMPKWDLIPKLKNPLDAIPKFKSPFSDPPSSISKQKEQYKSRLKKLGIDEHCLVEKVDSEFYRQHPELDQKALNQNHPESLRAEWYGIADRLMDDANISAECK